MKTSSIEVAEQMRWMLRTKWWFNGLIALLLVCLWAPANASKNELPGITKLTKYIPERSSSALTGSQFTQLLFKTGVQHRERLIREQLLEGNIPQFLRKLKPVRLQYKKKNSRLVKGVIFVLPDYLAIGSQADFIRMPMDFHTASIVAKQFGFILPTRRIVDAIYEQSKGRFTPQPLPPGPRMCSTEYYDRHNRTIMRQQHLRGIVLGDLVAGHKKDVVLTNRLMKKPGRIAIYGWHKPCGTPIQPLSTVHGAGYADYSHGVRLVSEQVLIDGKFRSIYEIFKDPELAFLLSDEGALKGIKSSQKRITLSANLQF